MTKYSDWTIIPADRKCDLPPDAKVQVMSVEQSLKSASRNTEVKVAYYLDGETNEWAAPYFAYRVVQEPVEEVREYELMAALYNYGIPSFWCVAPQSRTEAVKGTATQTTRDGKPYRFVWEAASE